MNEYYEESITTEDYINCNKTYEIEANPGLEEIIANSSKDEEMKAFEIEKTRQGPLITATFSAFSESGSTITSPTYNNLCNSPCS
ncbi:22516_t:CDS:2 [Entrophospora sp. SA101]|nr:22516_t:CDS:2 [Entrophospora sp. SA101]